MKLVVRQWYKTLLFMGREYPEQSGGYKKFRVVLKKHFQNTPAGTDVEFQKAIEKAEYAEKGMSRDRDRERERTEEWCNRKVMNWRIFFLSIFYLSKY